MRPPRLPRRPHSNPGVEPDAGETRGYTELISLTLVALAFVLAATGCASQKPAPLLGAGGTYGEARYTDRVAPPSSSSYTPRVAPRPAEPSGPALLAPGNASADTGNAGSAAPQDTAEGTPAGDLIDPTEPSVGASDLASAPLNPAVGSGPSPFDPPGLSDPVSMPNPDKRLLTPTF